MRLPTLTALLLVLGLLPAACAPADVTVEESSDAAPVAEEAANDTADDQTAQRTTSPVTWHPQSGEEGEVTGAEAGITAQPPQG